LELDVEEFKLNKAETVIADVEKIATEGKIAPLAGFGEKEATRFFGPVPEVSAAFEKDYLTPWSAKDAEARYLKCFAALVKD